MIDLNHHEGVSSPTRLGEFCQLRVVLVGPEPEIWRRLVVPTDCTFGWLHAVLQISMGWTNSHLHKYQFGNQLIADPKFELEEFEESPPVLNETKTHLNELLSNSGDRFTYEYDFGDSWEHVVTVEELSDPGAGKSKKAVCLDGERACPPEDCGGVPGYERLLEILQDREDPEHKSMHEWLGRPFNSEFFSITESQARLDRLTWPKVTEAGLRKLMLSRLGR